MQALVETIDESKPVRTHDVLEVLVNLLAQTVIVHAIDRAGARQAMENIVHALAQSLREAKFQDNQKPNKPRPFLS